MVAVAVAPISTPAVHYHVTIATLISPRRNSVVHSSKAKELLTNPALGLGLELFGITTAVLRCGCERCFCTTDDHRRTSHCPNSVGIAERVAASRLRCPFFSIERRRCALLDPAASTCL